MTTKQVLIIDDEPDIRELLELTLGRMDLETRAAANLSEGRHLLSEFKFDLCLTDMRLPDGNGLEMVRHIQEHFPDLPVAVITAFGNIETAVLALKAGAFDFVSKPVDINDLRNIVSSALKVKRPDEEQIVEIQPPAGSEKCWAKVQRFKRYETSLRNWPADRRLCTSAVNREPVRNWRHA